MTIILGIDPGSRITGYGIIQAGMGRRGGQASHAYIASGCIKLKSAHMAENLGQIFSAISALIQQYAPEEAAIEKIFMNKNADSAIKLGQARGAGIVAAVQSGLAVAEYSARQVKQAVVGYGAAAKTQVQHMVCSLLELSGMPQADAADALAIAICHANSRFGLGVLEAHIQYGYRRGRRWRMLA